MRLYRQLYNKLSGSKNAGIIKLDLTNSLNIAADTSNFNTICGNDPDDQIDSSNSYPNNYISSACMIPNNNYVESGGF